MEAQLHSKQFVTFLMGKELYGINIFNTQEIIRVPEITPIPNSKSYIEGIINLRGDVIPVINLETKFQIPSNGIKKEVIVIRSQGEKLGIMVEKVFRVIQVDESEISPPPSILTGVDEEYILGVLRLEDNKLIIFLNIEQMFFDDAVRFAKDLNNSHP
jgi:purine-binding chemotaxis protein CheW